MKKQFISLFIITLILSLALLCGCSLFNFSDKNEDDKIQITFIVDGKEYEVVDVTDTHLTFPGAPTKSNFTFAGWYTAENMGGEKLTEGMEITKSAKAYAGWLKRYTVTLHQNGKDRPNTFTVTEGDVLRFSELYVTSGYTAEGFYQDEALTMPFTDETEIYGDTNVYAKLELIEFNIAYNGLQGAINPNPQTYNVENVFELKAPIGFYDRYFDGWYSGEAKVNTLENIYSDITLEAKWAPYQRINKDGEPSTYGDFLLWGFYPQTIKADDVTLSETTDDRGYILGSDNCYYAALSATPDSGSLINGVTFSDGTTPESGKTYYFKVEPLMWKIQSHASGSNPTIHLLSVVDISTFKLSTYGSHFNYYANSTLKSHYFNRDILKYFSNLQLYHVALTTIDTSGSSAGLSEPLKDDPDYASVQDGFYTFSASEINSPLMGFSSEKRRQIVATDYAKAKGVLCNSDGYACWWTRSHASSDPQSMHAQIVDYDGKLTVAEVYTPNIGVLPVCVFSFEKIVL